MALSAAATLAAVGVVVWMSQQIITQPALQTAKQKSPIQLANAQINPRSNPYLLAHQEFSPSTDMNGGATYIRIVPLEPEGQ